ncbi:MAG: hypothetical protein LH473_09355, partial [Chitinophagales bacterium]|nr:hypothetical protein [Chitinophagales bacterium]
MKTKIFVTLQIILTSIFIAAAQPRIIDNTFGANGTVTSQIINDEHLNSSLEIQEDGKIVLGGTVHLT